MDEFLKILQDMNGAATNPKQLLCRQASRHDEMRENRFGTTHIQLHRHDREDELGDCGPTGVVASSPTESVARGC
jgi:hypothetical protein